MAVVETGDWLAKAQALAVPPTDAPARQAG